MGGDHFLNLQPGTIVNGKYEVVKCLGTGSMGMVYACRHRELAGHIVAMKVLFAEVARDEVAAARFRNEIVASYNISHPNVVRAYEYFRDGDLLAFTMEYIGGGDLADRVGNGTEIPIDEIINMLCQMASGVQAIHDAGIVHRDLKPENILITAQGDIKITDFGIARTGTGPKLTEHGGVVGTIDYVSPEYLEEGQVDRRSDIYAVGILAYEMITGANPFEGKSVMERMTLKLRSSPTPPHHLRADCPVPLSNIILKAMSRRPGERYQQAREMLQDLENIRSSRKQRGSGNQPAIRQRAENRRPVAEEPRGMVASGLEALGAGASGAALGGAGAPYVGPPTSFREAVSPVRAASGSAHARVAPPRPSEQREAVLPRQSPPVNTARSGRQQVYRDPLSVVEERVAPSVSVSQGRLSSHRIKELSLDLYQPRRLKVQTVAFRMLVIFVGFGVGILGLKHFVPEFFGEAPAVTSQTFE